MDHSQAMARVRANPRDPQAWLALGQAMVAEGERDKARDCFNRALKLDPQLEAAHDALAALERPAPTLPDWLADMADTPARPPADAPPPRRSSLLERTTPQLEPARGADPEPPLPRSTPPAPTPPDSAMSPSPALESAPRRWGPILLGLLGMLSVCCVAGLLGAGYLWQQNSAARVASTATALVGAAALPAATNTSVPTFPATWTPLPATPTRTPTPSGPYEFGDPTATPIGDDLDDATFQAAVTSMAAGEYKDVVEQMEAVLAEQPELAAAHRYRGRALYELGEYDEALEALDRALELNRGYAQAYHDRGMVRAALEDGDGARADWLQAIDYDPSLYDAYIALSELYHERELYEEQLVVATQAVQIDEERPEGWHWQARAYAWLEQHDRCLASARRSRSADESYLLSHYSFGLCLYKTKTDYQEARAHMALYLEAYPDDSNAWFHQGAIIDRLAHQTASPGEDEYYQLHVEAAEAYSRGLALDASSPGTIINRAVIYEEMEEYELALTDYYTALSFGDIPRAYEGLGDVYKKLGQYEDALVAYETAIDLLPSHIDLYIDLADLYFLMEEYQVVVELSTELLEVDTVSYRWRHYYLRGQAYYELGEYEAAIADLTETIRSRPNSLAYYYRGLAYEANNQHAKAIEDYAFLVRQAEEHGWEAPEIDAARQRLEALEAL